MEKRTDWHIPGQIAEPPDSEPGEVPSTPSALPPLVTVPKPAKVESTGKLTPERPSAQSGGRIEIEPVEGGLDELLKKLEQ